MPHWPEDIVELSTGTSVSSAQNPGRTPRPWVAIFWKCCHAYSRVYRRPESDCYQGRCPKCMTPVRLRVGPDGTPCRFFTAE